jgi:WD40 repeat protein
MKNNRFDLLQIRVFNYNTLERVHNFDAHSDYVRAIAVHPTQPFILTSSGKLQAVVWVRIDFMWIRFRIQLFR